MNKNSKVYQSVRKGFYGVKNLPQNTKLAIDTHSIKKFKDKHKGETCFVIGNGPSMTIADLDKIHELNIPSFACNKIYKVFPQTKWRPNYYLSSDDKIIEQINPEEIGISIKNMFFPRIYKNKIFKGNFYNILSYRWLKEGKFSTDAHKGIYQCGTIVAEAIQFAYYMGFSTIYIVGVDFSYFHNSKSSDEKTYKYSGENNYFIKDYMQAGEIANIPDKQGNLFGFNAAKECIEENGRHIFNATRGGQLEVFVRKNLDDVFNELEGLK